jgi:hypothetical protein
MIWQMEMILESVLWNVYYKLVKMDELNTPFNMVRIISRIAYLSRIYISNGLDNHQLVLICREKTASYSVLNQIPDYQSIKYFYITSPNCQTQILCERV